MIKRFRIGSVLGIPLEVDVTLLLVLPFITWAIATDVTVVTEILQSLTGVSFDVAALSVGIWPWVLGAFGAVGLFCSVGLHELGHSVVAVRRGYDVESIQLWLLGGVAQFVDQPDEWTDELSIALAGPAVSVVLGGGGLVLLQALPASVPRVQFLVGYLGVMNIMLATFNMLPGFPMDGGRVLRALLSRNRSLPVATDLAATVGKGIAVCIGILGILSFNLLLIAIAIFVYVGASAESSQVWLESTFEGTTAGDLMTPAEDVETVGTDTAVPTLLEQMYEQRHTGYPVVEDGTVRGIVTLEDVSGLDESRQVTTRVEAVMSGDPISVGPDTPAVDALERMQEAGIGRLVVTDESGTLVGLLSRSDLLTAVSVARESPQVDWVRTSESNTATTSG